jgi:TetR/AcrR family transcriptional repressor of nem operon
VARKSEFDREKVLENAMKVFWEDGYCQTSMSRLVEVTGLNPGSIYSAFKSKEGLFSISLDRYGKRSVESLRQCLDQAATPLQGIKAFFDQLGDEIANDRKGRGCFLVNTALEMSPHNEQIREQVNSQLRAMESLFLNALQSAQERGELAARYRPAELAKFMMSNIWGFRVLGQTDADRRDIQASIDMLMSMLEND